MKNKNGHTMEELARDIYEGYTVHKCSIPELAQALRLSETTIALIIEQEREKRNGTVTQHAATVREND